MENQKVLKNISLIKNKINLYKKNLQIIAISKKQPLERVIAALDFGHKIYGENQVQETINKWPQLKLNYKNIELHLVGPLQSNKVKDALSIFDVIQTIDREKIANALKKEEDNLQKKISYMIQINTGKESQKSGVLPNEADNFFKYCVEDLKLNIKGLMCIPPYNEDPSSHFKYLKEKKIKYKLPYLSMGMSEDYEKAISFGATHIRVGTAIFGERPKKLLK
tara:strand:+ start:8936 stop:9601 length:666 start_codon:yes stop_codon:yes gene_type:complete